MNCINSSPHEFNTFVGNRVAFIQSFTETEMWGHVASKQNQADLVSRGQLPAIGETLCTYEELYTYMCEVEGILNSRLLTPISFDPNDFQVLTTGHFWISEPISSIPSLKYSQVANNRLSIWQHIQNWREIFKKDGMENI